MFNPIVFAANAIKSKPRQFAIVAASGAIATTVAALFIEQAALEEMAFMLDKAAVESLLADGSIMMQTDLGEFILTKSA